MPLSRRGSKGDELLDSFEDKPEGSMPAGVDVSPEMQAAIWNSFEVKQADLGHILQELHHLLYEILDTHSYLAASFAVGTEAIEPCKPRPRIFSVSGFTFLPIDSCTTPCCGALSRRESGRIGLIVRTG